MNFRKFAKYINIVIFFVLVFSLVLFASNNYLKAQEPAQPAEEKTKSLIEEYNTKKVLQEGIGPNFPTDETVTENSLYKVIGGFIDIILGLVGVLLIILIIYGGYLWFSADGNEEQIGKAKAYVINAIIGLAIVLLAYVITSYVMGKISSDITGLTQ